MADAPSAGLGLMGAVKSPTKVAMISVGALTLLGLVTLLLIRRNGREQPGVALARDIASVSLDGRGGGRHDLVAKREHPRGAMPPMTGVVHRHSLEPTHGAAAPVAWGDDIPQTREEALRILGMGVAPNVNDAAIKKIIDGLRLSWHPDHADNPADRELREQRMKQINAAWDIIAGRRGEQQG